MARMLLDYRQRRQSMKKRRELERNLHRARAVYEPLYAKAENDDQKMAVSHEMMYECSEFEDEIQRLDSIELEARAKRFHLSVSDLPAPDDAPLRWVQGSHGAYYIHEKLFRELARQVQDAEHEHKKRRNEIWDFWIKVYTAIAASAGAIGGIITLMSHLK